MLVWAGTVVIAGLARVVAGRGGALAGAVLAAVLLVPGVAGAQTNLVGNPAFETGTSGWNTSGGDAGVTLTQVAGGHSGSYAVEVDNTTSSVATCVLNDSPNWVRKTSPGSYTASLWVRGDGGPTAGPSAAVGLSLSLTEYTPSGGGTGRSSYVSLTSDWQQVSLTLPISYPGSTLDVKAEVSRWHSRPGPGACFYADDVALTYTPPGPPPAPVVAVNPASGVAPLDVSATASDTGGVTPGTLPIASYTFDFGDGSGAVGPQPAASATHTYSAPGTYTLTTTATDTAGNTSTTRQQVTAYPNLATNAGFETATTGWNTSSSSAGVTLTQVPNAHTGTGAALLTNTGTTPATCNLNDSPNIVRNTSAGRYTATLWVRADNPGATLTLRLREWAGTTAVFQAKTAVTLTSQWQPVTVQYIPVDPGASTLDLSAYIMNAPPGTCFYADDASVWLQPAGPQVATTPTSRATSPSYVNSHGFAVNYTASDYAGGSGLAKVALYAKGPSDSGYTIVASDTSPSGTGSFAYNPTEGDGVYSFYTIATDKAGSVQPTPASPDTTTVLDTTAPTSTASSPSTSDSNALTVTYTASDAGSGLMEVDLYAKGPADSSYFSVGTISWPPGSGSFTYTATEGAGTYSFYTITVDKAWNVEATPATPDATTVLSASAVVTGPISHASSPAFANSGSLTVTYTAADKAGGSGLARVDLYEQGPGDHYYGRVASTTAPSGSGSFSFTPNEGDGVYNFYTIATDNAGNVQATPASPDTVTWLDTVPPTSTASSPQSASAPGITISYAASDDASGLAEVVLYAKGPGDSGYTKVATDVTSSRTGSFSYTASEGDGTYSFYTLAIDNAGNTEGAPATPDSTTTLSTAGA